MITGEILFYLSPGSVFPRTGRVSDRKFHRKRRIDDKQRLHISLISIEASINEVQEVDKSRARAAAYLLVSAYL